MSIFQSKLVKDKLDEAFTGREPLGDSSFYEKYFAASGVPQFVVVKVRRILEEEFDVDLSRLSAADDFAKNLSFVADYSSLDAVEVVLRLEEDFGIEISDAEAEQTTTVEGIIKMVSKKFD